MCPPQINITHLGFNPRIALCSQHQLPETVQTLAAEGILVMPGSICEASIGTEQFHFAVESRV